MTCLYTAQQVEPILQKEVYTIWSVSVRDTIYNMEN